ncbi:MAG TPA: ring-cleaving dioxygenase [Gemmatimonadaceae bacterium]|nr:ring-cleaving dioxygenase [Gemmatimonadaceae bacterium]
MTVSLLTGLHHVTAIAGDAQENVDFYSGVLGMRLVKKSVNQDSPGTYHLFYGDGVGHPGSDITFFPWREMPPVRPGVGLSVEVSLAVPAGSLEFWRRRLTDLGVRQEPIESRRGSTALPLKDPHGLPLALVETGDDREFTPWLESPVPQTHQILGLHSVRLWERDLALTSSFLTETLGFEPMGAEGEWSGFSLHGGGSGRYLEIREMPETARGQWGAGGVHHVAWRVPDEATELEARERIALARRRPTPVIDRFWFKSVYFLEPGGVLFEVATDGPGFTADEAVSALGEQLVLPPWLEARRDDIEAGLPPLRPPASAQLSTTK